MKKATRIRVEVTALDIEEGIPSVSCRCPLARAIKRATGLRKVWVFGDVVEFKQYKSAKLPRKCAEFVKAIDIGNWVKPFSFSFKLPEFN